MSKVVSALSVTAVIALFLVLGGTLVSVTGLQPDGDAAVSDPVTAFTYQGYLTQSQEPANGSFDLAFALYDDPDPNLGNQVGTTLFSTLTITDGLFTVELDFGSVFDGTPLWLEVGVRPTGQKKPFTPLLPRQRLTAVPFSAFATLAASASWAGLTDLPAGFADNVDNDRLARLSCAPGQIPEWSGTTWTCGDDDVSPSNGGGDITAVHTDYGLGGGSDSGDVTLYVVSETIQARVDGLCPSGQSIRAIDQDGNVTCELDDDTTYAAGNQMTLTGTTFDLVEGAGSDLDADLLDGQDGDYYLTWGNLITVPAGFDDGDDDTLSDLTCSDGQLPKWDSVESTWTCAGDLDTTYQAGVGLTLSDTTFAISSTYQLPQICGFNQTVKWNGSAWACGTDEIGGGGSAWLLTGNAGTSPGTNFLGTTDDQALEFRVDNARALRLDPNGASPNILGGYSGNSVDAGVAGATIGGGGRDLATNQANGNYSTVDGGAGNTAGGYASAVGGGEGNSAGGSHSAVGGGSSNTASGDYAAVGGGQGNTVTGTHATIAGGGSNQASAAYASVGGGTSNVVSGTYATVGGGQGNVITGTHATVAGGISNTVTGDYAAVGGGSYNSVVAAYGTIAGGGPEQPGNPTTTNNRVYDDYGTVGGGGGNTSGLNDGEPTLQDFATVGGGLSNAAEAEYAAVGGGWSNHASGYAATVGGGEGNTADSNSATVSGGSNNSASAKYATVGGGWSNVVSATRGTVGGGQANTVTGAHATIAGGGSNQASAAYASVGGGTSNVVSGTNATVGGGQGNVITAFHATVAGGISNTVTGDYAAVGGGSYNQVDAAYGTIAGGGPSDTGNPTTSRNRVFDDYGTVGGGAGNVAGDDGDGPTVQKYATVGGGEDNTASGGIATVGGGSTNTAGGYAATVSGGSTNSATNNYATVSGGSTNSASNQYATVGGGWSNVVSAAKGTVAGGSQNIVAGPYGTIPGGQENHVGGGYGFAAGYQARAEHLGAFVWSDATGTFTSTAPNQFLIDASGGVGIGTNAPSHLLTVEGGAAIQSSDVISVGAIVAYTSTLQMPRALYAVGDLLYAAGYATNTLSVWNVQDPTAQTLIGYTTFQLEGPVDLQVVGNRAYLASQNRNMLTILDVSDPADISHVGDTTEFLDHPQGVHVSGKYAYVASQGYRDPPSGPFVNDGLTVFDITDAPAEIAATSFISTYLDGPSDVFVVDKYAYVTSLGNNRLVAFDVSDPRHPTPVSYTSESLNQPVRVHVSGIYAYVVAEGADSVVVFDVSNPLQITFVGQVQTDHLTRPRSIYLSGDRAYVAYAGDGTTNLNCGLAVLDISDPAHIVVLNEIDMSDWGLVPPKPVAITGSGDRIYVANERHDSVTIFEIDGLQASAVRTGELQVARLEVADYAAIEGDLGVRGGLNVGPGGALVQGTLSVEGAGDSYIQGRLGIGPVATVITKSVSPTEYEEIVLPHPTHQLDVDGEARFRVNDHNHLVLRSRNTGSDEDAFIDFVDFTYPDLITPSARIEFDAADPITHSTSIRFYTQGPGDGSMSERLRIDEEGDLLPASSGDYSLGSSDFRWAEVWTIGGPLQLSDVRYKENVRALAYGLEEVRALRPVAFAWRGDPAQEAHYGFIAQEVRELLPEVVTGDDGENGTLSMNYSELVPVLVRAVQEQQDEIEVQAEQIAALEARLASLEAGQADQSGQPRVVNPLTTFGFGGLVLGAVALVGLRRKGGRP